MATNSSTPVTDLDFFTVKEQLKAYLKGQPQFADYDFEGANMNVLLDILAYNTFTNNFYTNMAFSEQFLDSAQLRTSVNSRAKELNYLPSSYASSVAKINVTFNPTDSPATITIPKNTRFTGRSNNQTYTFSTDSSTVIRPNANGDYIASNVSIYEGRLITENFVVSANNERFLISNKKIDIDSLEVYVRESTNINSANTEYTRQNTLFGVGATDNVFYLQPSKEEQYEIYFGQNQFGTQPVVGNVVEAKYRISSGAAPNGINTFSATGNIAGYSVSVSTAAKAEGGSTNEDVDSIKFFAPKAVQIQDRAITENDYEILLKNRFAEIQAVSVYGGEQLDPPQYGRVVVSVDIENQDGVSQNAKQRFQDYLVDRSPLAIEPIVVSPEFMYVDVISTVYYNTTQTTKSGGDISTLVSNAIQSYSNTNLADFNKTIRYSKFVKTIDDADPSIVSNDTDLRAIIEIEPTLNSNNNIAIEFRNTLEQDSVFTEGETNYNPTISSTAFTYQGTKSFLQDDGEGNIQIISSTTAGTSFLNRSAGTVNYSTGRVALTNFNVSDFEGAAIKVYAKTDLKDITSPKSRIIRVRPADVNLTVTGIRA